MTTGASDHIVDGPINTEVLSFLPDRRCQYFGRCGNIPPPGEEICPDCLTALRKRDRIAEYTDYAKHLDRARGLL